MFYKAIAGTLSNVQSGIVRIFYQNSQTIFYAGGILISSLPLTIIEAIDY
jgi:hypothetical protein